MTGATSEEDSAETSSVGMLPWVPEEILRPITEDELRYSRGFLQSKPERWFPGLASRWIPLAQSVGATWQVNTVRPTIEVPPSHDIVLYGSVDNEAFGMGIDGISARAIVESIAPAARDHAAVVLLEYLARRLVASLGVTWSAIEQSSVHFEPEPQQMPSSNAAVVLEMHCNGHPVELWLRLGPRLAERLDKLWRKQVVSSTREMPEGGEWFIELAQLAVPSSNLSQYLLHGTAIDLEVAAGDAVTIRTAARPTLTARLRVAEGRFALETLGRPSDPSPIPQGTTRVSVILGSFYPDPALLAECAQRGAIVDSGIPIHHNAIMMINGQKVGEATVCQFEGRFALMVK